MPVFLFNIFPDPFFHDVNMILWWRNDIQRPTIFNGEGDVGMFFFYFGNIVLRGKEEAEKSVEILAKLYGRGFE